MNKHRFEAPAGDPAGGGGGNPPAPPAPPAPPSAPWHGDFAADAPADFREWVGNKAFKDPQAALLSQFNLEKLVGAEKAQRTVIWPKDENDKEAHAALRAKLGVPEKAEDYGLAPGEGENAAFVAEASKWMHELGIPKAAATGLMEKLRTFGKQTMDEAHTAAETASKAELAALDKEWGQAAAENKALAKRFAGELGLSAEDMSAIEGALGTAKFMKMFHAGGVKLGEHGKTTGDPSNQRFGITQAQAKEKLEAKRADRAAGKISEADWLEASAQLAPIAYPSA